MQFTTNVFQVFLINLSPETIVASATPSSAAQTLRVTFDWDFPYNRGAVFTEKALPRLVPGVGGVYAEVDFDRETLLKTTRQLEQFGFSSGSPPDYTEPCDEKLSGEALLSRFDSLPPEAANDRLHLQGDLVRCLFGAAQAQGWDIETLFNNLRGRFYSSPKRVSEALEAAPPLAKAQFISRYVPLDPLAVEPPPDMTPQP
jgi:hypothetical protein